MMGEINYVWCVQLIVLIVLALMLDNASNVSMEHTYLMEYVLIHVLTFIMQLIVHGYVNHALVTVAYVQIV